MWQTYRTSGDTNAFNEFKRLRSKIKSEIRISYSNFVQRTESDIKSDPSKFWAYVNSKKGVTNISKHMHYNNQTLTTTDDILNAFANFFSESYISDTDDLTLSPDSVINNLNIHIRAFDEVQVLQAIKKIKPKLTTGPDGVPAFLIRDCAQIFSYPLMILFNLCLSSGTFPDMWKRSKLCPIYKNGDKFAITNFRPISIICNFCKILETLLHDSIYPSVSTQISPYQHGFMKGRSTTTNLLSVTQHIAEVLDAQSQSDIIYTDFSKAFDRLNHSILLRKLNGFGLSYSLLQLLRSYLSNRIQYVAFNGVKSVEFFASSGVPQGSVLGPLLFNIFINDITATLDVCCLLYADDLKIFNVITRIEDCYRLQDNLDRLSLWCLDNKLPLNASKCNVMSFTRKSNPHMFNYHLDGTALKRPDTFRDLGVIFDPKLAFNAHIENVVGNSFKTLGFIVRCSREFTDINTLRTLYCCFVRSKLEYASLVWSPNYDLYINNLENVQRKFLKLLYFKSNGIYPPIGYPQQHLLSTFGMSSLDDRRQYFSQVFLYKVVHNILDCQEIVGQLNFHVPRPGSRQEQTFYIPTARTNTLKNSPIFFICDSYNKYCNRIDIFHCSLNDIKSYLKH